jgi:hypothetical protein
MSENTNNTICSQEEFEEKVRPDLEDISNTINHLLQLSNYFYQKTCKWGKWWNSGVADSIYRKGNGDKEIIQAAEWAYSAGAGFAQTLSDVLPKINDIGRCPKLKDYVKQIRDIQNKTIVDDRKLIARCKKIIRARKPLDYSDVGFMLEWHKEHLKILRDLDNDLAAIEGSERYKIEEQKQYQTGENATLKSKIKDFLWTLYEKTLKVVVDAVLEKMWPK